MSCNNYNTGKSPLPDMFAQHLRAWASTDISENVREPVLQLICS